MNMSDQLTEEELVAREDAQLEALKAIRAQVVLKWQNLKKSILAREATGEVIPEPEKQYYKGYEDAAFSAMHALGIAAYEVQWKRRRRMYARGEDGG